MLKWSDRENQLAKIAVDYLIRKPQCSILYEIRILQSQTGRSKKSVRSKIERLLKERK